VTASAAGQLGGYADAVALDVPLDSWRIGVVETGFGENEDRDAEPVSDVVRTAISRLEELGVSTTRGLEIADLAGWIEGTSVYVKQSKADISDFLAQRPDAPVSSFMEIYDGRHFHPLNDLFHGIAEGPETVDGDVEYLRRRLNQEHFRRHMLRIFATHGLDFLVYPTVQVIPPTRDELAAEKYQCLTFPTNTVIGSQAGLPALTIPVGFTSDGLPVGLELLGVPLAEAKMLQFARSWERDGLSVRRTWRPAQFRDGTGRSNCPVADATGRGRG
jgi:amidase